MSSEDLTMEEKCENLMSVVVESRKRFGKMCVDYEKKSSVIENKMLNLVQETISNYKFTPKQAAPDLDVDAMSKDTDDFMLEVIKRRERIQNLLQNIRNTQEVVMQMKKDNVEKKLQDPLSAQAMLARAKQLET